jgi:hypothetical protein
MQPNTSPTSPVLVPTPRRNAVRRRFALGAATVALTALLAACGGSSDGDAAKPDASGSETTAAPSSDSGAEETTTSATGGAPDIDLCEEVPKEDVAAILTEAELTRVEPNPSLSVPNCGYAIEIGGGGSEMTADVVTITWNEPGFYDGQKELQTDATELTGFDTEAFTFGDHGTVLVQGATGAFMVTHGVELAEGGQPASPEQLAAIAKLVQGL